MTKSELEQCINDFGKDIYSFCRQVTLDVHEADDLYQDTFLKAFELKNRINLSDNPKSYILSIAVRLWKNKKRKFAWRKRIAGTRMLAEGDNSDEAPHEEVPEEIAVKQEEKRLVNEAVGKLPDTLKIVTLLYYMENQPLSQIARILKIPEGTVKSRLYKARITLKNELEGIMYEG